MHSRNQNSRIIALDVGAKRVGIASANVVARLASPVTTLKVTGSVFEDIKKIAAEQTAISVIVGLPRGLNGQETDQTREVRRFVEKLHRHLSIPIHWQDEALTSRLSEAELKAKGKAFAKEAIDALAACYILEDYLEEYKDNE